MATTAFKAFGLSFGNGCHATVIKLHLLNYLCPQLGLMQLPLAGVAPSGARLIRNICDIESLL
ncbi:hypothetical protein T05_11155 [Trichinella murrelli]|uniref:Uncharacterized protein n=1 Tax=Trichinella murrelli TaxID=144512 RepID=A0A0V0TF19_9BILA|nr:hypothetical protein T05_11155 [Trichinella murrelli]